LGGRGPIYRADGNAKQLDERARAHGVSIWRAERPFDRLWGLSGLTVLVEYKNRATAYGRAGLNPLQKAIADSWRGNKVYIIETVEDVDSVVAEIRRLGRALRDLMKLKGEGPG
jgi:hypothetical protein